MRRKRMIAVNKYVNRQHLLQYSLDEQLIHGMRVSNLAYQVAKELGEPEEFCHDLAVAGMLHDIGKEAVSGDLDDMDAPLIVEEIHYVRLHAQASYEILKKEGTKRPFFLQCAITMKIMMAAVILIISQEKRFRWGPVSSVSVMYMRH